MDGRFAFGCNINVVAKFRLREGLVLTEDELARIRDGEVQQECFDRAIRFIETRMHSRKELSDKLKRNEYPIEMIDAVLDRLTEMGYVNDAKFATGKVEAAAKYKHQGPNRARIELAKKGVDREVARQVVEEVFESHNSMSVARDLARKKMRSLSRLEPVVAKRRLYGMLLRRGFDYDTIKPVVEEVLGGADEE